MYLQDMQKSSYLFPEKLYPKHFTPEGNSVTVSQKEVT